jgi:hypothetical protein
MTMHEIIAAFDDEKIAQQQPIQLQIKKVLHSAQDWKQPPM